MKTILERLSKLQSASIADFESLQALLNHKIETLAGNLVSEKERANSIHQMIAAVSSPILQCDLVARLRHDSPEIFGKIRLNLVVPTDLRFFPGRVKSMLIQSIDADTLGTALSDFGVSFEPLLEGLPATYQSVFRDAQSRRYDAPVVNASWKRVHVVILELVSSGLISKNDIAATIRRADSPIEDEETNKSPEEENLGAA